MASSASAASTSSLANAAKFFVERPGDEHWNTRLCNAVIEAEEQPPNEYGRVNLKILAPRSIVDKAGTVPKEQFIECSGPARELGSFVEYVRLVHSLIPTRPLPKGWKTKFPETCGICEKPGADVLSGKDVRWINHISNSAHRACYETIRDIEQNVIEVVNKMFQGQEEIDEAHRFAIKALKQEVRDISLQTFLKTYGNEKLQSIVNERVRSKVQAHWQVQTLRRLEKTIFEDMQAAQCRENVDQR